MLQSGQLVTGNQDGGFVVVRSRSSSLLVQETINDTDVPVINPFHVLAQRDPILERVDVV